MSYFKIFRMAAGTLFWALALLSSAGVSSQTLELSGAQVVTSGDDPLVRKAAEVLVDELALRTGVTLSAAGTMPRWAGNLERFRRRERRATNCWSRKTVNASSWRETIRGACCTAWGVCCAVANCVTEAFSYLRRQRFHRLPSMRSGGMNCILRRGPSPPTKHGPRRTSNSMSANWRFSG